MARSDEMNTLAESFLEACDNRIAQIAGICGDTAQILSESMCPPAWPPNCGRNDK